MSDILAQLHLDHMQYYELLQLLGSECAGLEAHREVDTQTLHCVMEYVREYVYRVHHPSEDAIYALIDERYPDSGLPVHELLTEHQDLHELAGDIEAAVLASLHGSANEKTAAAKRLRSLIATEVNHMHSEEREVFPLLRDVLDEDDWREVDERSPPPEQPTVAVRYPQIWGRLQHGQGSAT